MGKTILVDTAADPTVYTYATTAFDPEDFPFSPVYDDPDAPTSSDSQFFFSFFYGFALYTATDYDRLKAVIRKNNTWYYIWSTA